MTTLTSNWSYPTTIWFGAGRIAELAAACHQAGIKKPLLVTDKGLADLPITQNALASLAGAGVEAALFAEVDPNPTEINMEAGLQAYKAGQHDGVIAFGGGSGLDLGKMVAFMAGQTRPGHYQFANSRKENYLPSENIANCGDLRPATDCWNAGFYHRWYGHGCLCTLS